MKVAVVGGGPSGLVTLKWLATAQEYFDGPDPIEVRLFEAEESIGGTFRYRVWKDAEVTYPGVGQEAGLLTDIHFQLVSSKYLTAFSDHRFATEAPEFVTPEAYLAYMDSYVARYKLSRYIECSSKVVNVSRTVDGKHLVTLLKKTTCADTEGSSWIKEDWLCDAVAICSGINVHPNIPDIPGLHLSSKLNLLCEVSLDIPPLTAKLKAYHHHHKPKIVHSCSYKSADIFRGAETVVVLGAGETAMDIGHQAVHHPDVQRVILCHREGFMIAPKRTPEPVICGIWGAPYPGKRPNKPIDTTVASLFDTMYVPPVIQRGQLLWIFYDWWIKFIFMTIAGTTWGIDQWVGGVPQVRRHSDSLLIVKSDKLIPWLSENRRKGVLNAIRALFINVPIQETNGTPVDLKPFPTHMTDDGLMHFPKVDRDPMVANTSQDNVVKPDVVILATGYRTKVDFLSTGYPNLADATKNRGIYRNIKDGIAYIGFVRPSIGMASSLRLIVN